MRFAFLIMGQFDDKTDRVEIHNGMAQIIGVVNMGAAINAARELQREGVDCIELCGAFGEDGARKIMKATGNMLPIGYITHLKEQEDVYCRAFSKVE